MFLKSHYSGCHFCISKKEVKEIFTDNSFSKFCFSDSSEAEVGVSSGLIHAWWLVLFQFLITQHSRSTTLFPIWSIRHISYAIENLSFAFPLPPHQLLCLKSCFENKTHLPQNNSSYCYRERRSSGMI